MVRSKCFKRSIPNLYNIVRRKNATILNIFSVTPLNISFRRSLVGENLNSWHTYVLRIIDIHLNDELGIFK
jgi:hypothetical protein